MPMISDTDVTLEIRGYTDTKSVTVTKTLHTTANVGYKKILTD